MVANHLTIVLNTWNMHTHALKAVLALKPSLIQYSLDAYQIFPCKSVFPLNT